MSSQYDSTIQRQFKSSVSTRYVVWYNLLMSTKHQNPTYTLQPKMQDGRLVVYVVELDLTVKTDTTDIDQALHQASNAIVDYLEKQEEAAQVL